MSASDPTLNVHAIQQQTSNLYLFLTLFPWFNAVPTLKVLTTPSSATDQIANGLRSGTWLGGVGTGGYELRADGTFHLSTVYGARFAPRLVPDAHTIAGRKPAYM